MSKDWQILHLTDFHIGDPNAPAEHLREGFYREYIDGLVKCIRSEPLLQTPVDAAVFTGDFVDRGQLSHFKHAETVIRHLCDCLSITSDAVFVCNGNHDIDRELEKANKCEDARRSFDSFAKGLCGGAAISESGRARFVRTKQGAYGLMVDSTLGANGEDRAGTISTEEVDEMISLVRAQNISKDQILIVASHHPPNAALRVNGPFDETDSQWFEKHIWAFGHPLLTRLQDIASGPVLWLSGDIHKEAYVIDSAVHSVVTGRFGCSTAGGKSQVRRQARIIGVPALGDSYSWLFEYVPQGHVDHAQDGKWEKRFRKPEKHTRPSEEVLIHPAGTVVGTTAKALGASVEQKQGAERVVGALEGQLHLLSRKLQDEMMAVIAEEELYSLGRFVTSPAESTLGWISIGTLLDQEEFLVSAISEMAKWLTKLVTDEKPDEPVIIGIDSWGAILASQLSVTTGVRNFCVAARARGITHSASERISDTVRDAVARSDFIVLISDVIGTGRSLLHVFNELSERMTPKQLGRAKWALLSVICDEQHNREHTLAFASYSATVCKDLRIPILTNDRLPNDDILPPDISFVRFQ